MRLELTRVGLLVGFANHYTTRGARNKIAGVVCDETINHIRSECCKLAQKEYMTRHDRVKKVIYCELCKKLKFDRTNQWYMHNPKSVLENETLKLLRDFEIQTDHVIWARRPYLVIAYNKKKKCKKKREPAK